MIRAAILAGVLVSTAACSKTRVKECDDLGALAEKIEKCEKIPASSRRLIKTGSDQIRNALKVLEDVADPALEKQLEMLGPACKRQSDQIREAYAKVAPECLR